MLFRVVHNTRNEVEGTINNNCLYLKYPLWFEAWQRWRFLPQICLWSTEPPLLPNRCYKLPFFSVVFVCGHFVSVLERWLIGGFANVPPKEWALVEPNLQI